MRILAISWYSPIAPDSGDRIRFAALISGLARKHDLSVLTFDESVVSGVAGAQLLSPSGRERIPYLVPRKQVLWSWLRSRSVYHSLLASRRHARRRTRSAVRQFQPDLIFVNQLPPWPLVSTIEKARTVVDTQNAERPRLARMAERLPAWSLKRYVIEQQAHAAGILEREIAEEAGSVWAVSEADAEYFSALGGRAVVVPNGINLPRARWSASPPEFRADGVREWRILFLGSLSYGANLDALRHFTDVWAKAVDETDERWALTVVGSGDAGAARRITGGDSRLTVVGRVESVENSFLTHDALVVPMRLGGGTRLKVLEALAYGIPLISTRMGVEGLPLHENEHYLRAEDAQTYQAALRGLGDPECTDAMVSSGRRVAENYTWNSVLERAERDLDALARRVRKFTC